MAVRNEIDRFALVRDVIDQVPKLRARAAHVRRAMRDKLVEHREHVRTYGDDLPEIKAWTWRR
jgi:xylulose-5-phosphate/fructose-6-phosphate phosphoketolase